MAALILLLIVLGAPRAALPRAAGAVFASPEPVAADDADDEDAPGPVGEASVPRWIWAPHPARDDERLAFLRAFLLEAPVHRATLTVTADNAFELFLDGEPLASGDEWTVPVVVELEGRLDGEAGRAHLLAASVRNEGGPAGLLLDLALHAPGVPDRHVLSDAGWRWSAAPHDDWQHTDPGDELPDWSPVAELARLGGDPWGALDDEAWRLASLMVTPVATPAEAITAPDGFRVELLHSASASQGSWVVLAFDDRGRAYVSDQQDAGLYRLVLPPRLDDARGMPGAPDAHDAHDAHGTPGLPDARGAHDAPGAPDAANAANAPGTPNAPGAHGAGDAPGMPSWADEPVLVERVPVDLSGAQGLLWAWGDLYAVVNRTARHASGLYRLRDTDGDDLLDEVTLLTALDGSGEHGPHAVVRHPDGESLLVVAGNETAVPPLAASVVPPVWGEDLLLPRLLDPSGFMATARAPGGCVYRVDRDGRRWELLSVGYRNPYDLAVHGSGDVFTFDADMEWDISTPWYRPTRVCLVASGSEYGWRTGSGKWPPHHADSLPPVLEMGPGSPVGLAFGAGTDFPAPFREALFLADWSYGRVHAARLTPDGAGWRGESEAFLSGTPLPVTDLAVHPTDGALYLVTGGRDVQTGLYRVSWTGAANAPHARPALRADEAHALRRQLEALHGQPSPESLPRIWATLGHPDRWVRHAARVALEWQPAALWRERALAEADAATGLAALLALVRVSAGDPERGGRHPDPFDPALSAGRWAPAAAGPDATLAARVHQSLCRWPWDALDHRQRLDRLRVHAVCAIRLGAPDDARRRALLEELEPRFPDGAPDLDAALCELLVSLRSSRVVAAAVPLLSTAPTQEQQLELARSLRLAREGWTSALRQAFFDWIARAQRYPGGASFGGFVRAVLDDALHALEPAERAAVERRLATAREHAPATVPSILAGRTTPREWTLGELTPAIEARLGEPRDLTRGRALFGAAECFRCHRVAGMGGAVGPDLTGAGGRFSPRDLLRAVLEPSVTVSDQYQRTRIALIDGGLVEGQIVDLFGDTLQVRTDMFRPGGITWVDRRRVASISRSPLSPMPEGLLGLLTEDEIADLLAYLLAGGRPDARESH